MTGRHSCRWTWPLLLGVAVWAGLAAAAAGQGSAATDRAALEAIYRATGGGDWTNNANWLSSAPLEDWYGVEMTDGRVAGLRLGGWDETARRHVGNGLTGSLPADLGNLSRLRWLEIGGNSGLTGTIPAELGNLASLESLNLQSNWLTGSIPAGLGRLTELDFLGLEGNALTGSIPAGLGNLGRPRLLGFSGNPLTGRLPPEFGNLTSLADLGLGDTMLSGPLPETLTGLSALERLDVDGSGLCVPDTAAMKAWVATLSGFTGVVCEGAASFSRMVTPFDPGRVDFVSAVVDLDGDGHDDVLGGEYLEYNVAAPERLTKAPLHVFVGGDDGNLRHAPELVAGTIDVRTPIVVADDFNGDGRADLAVFDAGVYVLEESSGYGNPPQLFLSGQDGRLRPSDALAVAVRREHERDPPVPFSGNTADLHLKSATSGDIDIDGDIDLWVESTGGANTESHFMVNNGDGTFEIERARATDEVLRNNPPEYWRHDGNALVDLDNDGDLDLALGQIRDPHPTHVNQFSIVLVNDGTGHYPVRIELPHPAFADGYTSVPALTHFDVNGDGLQDLLLPHQRNDDGPADVIPWTGRYIQVLINRGGTSFGDETTRWLGDQSATTPERDAAGDLLHNVGVPSMHDVDRDGCADLVMSGAVVRTDSPLAYRNDGSGRFRAMSPVPFVGSSRYFGDGAVPADVNGDGAIDFVVPRHNNGPDHEYGTADDFGMLVTLLNTTPPRQPVISVDTKKKELVGNFKNGGREWQPKGTPPAVLVHDFPTDAEGKAIPYGVYDMARNEAWVSVGRDHDTPAFAVASIRHWWRQMGCDAYPDATAPVHHGGCGWEQRVSVARLEARASTVG